jgi:hypothetical protein
MKRVRFPIAGLMAAVALVAVNLAVWRSIELTLADGGISAFFFACGTVPVASVLFLVALMSLPRLVRGERALPFVVGFEAVGWALVFAFITCYSVAPWALLGYAELIGPYTRPVFQRYIAFAPTWIGLQVELCAGAVLFAVPQLLIALFGGCLTRKLGLSVRFERQRTDGPSVPPLVSASNAGRTDQPVLEWQVST